MSVIVFCFTLAATFCGVVDAHTLSTVASDSALDIEWQLVDVVRCQVVFKDFTSPTRFRTKLTFLSIGFELLIISAAGVCYFHICSTYTY